jgi:hypothetical protein
MRPRFAILTAVCGTIVLASWVVVGFAGHESLRVENADAPPIRESIAFRSEPVNAPQLPANDRTGVSSANVAMADQDPPAPAMAPPAVVEATSPATSPMPSSEEPTLQVATAPTSNPVQQDAPEAIATLETLDECFVADICIDQYLWAAYQRTPKLDTIKVPERKKVTVKKNGKTRTVTKTVSKLVDEDFTWKDPKAAEKAGMSLQDYVIGGMDRSFKIKLYHALRALDEAGLKPGITSAFRDDYRQSIAAGLKAANDRSYHGGSFRGGYSHGLAADLVSVKGATRAERWVSSESLWKWIDAHGKEYGVGRPYLDKDPPHVAPIDGKEYAGHRAANTKHAGADKKKKHNRVAARDGAAKPAKAQRLSKAGPIF